MQGTLSHFRVLEQIGQGGMGVVYRAHDERLERDVALKVLPEGSLADEAARKRFRKEALALSKLSHPNIATVHDFDTDNGTDFLVEELIPGMSLDEMLQTGPLSEREITNLGSQLSEGLAAAHEQGIVHRDLKPANVRVTPDARVKILDFGLAKVLRTANVGSDTDVTASLSESQQVSGTLPYMAPEQLLNEKLDARTDIWAAGCVLYEMATGQRPFLGSGPTLTDAILHQRPTPSTKLNRKLSPGLEAIITKCLEKDPSLRYASAKDLAIDLHRLSAGSVNAALAARHRSQALRAVAAVFVLVVIVAAAYAYWQHRRRTGRASGPKVIAVLYFKNMSQDSSLEWLSGGLTEMLTTNLGQIQGLEVLSTDRVADIRKRLKYKPDETLTPDNASEVAREAGADAFITGALIRLGPSRLRADVRLQETATGRVMFSDSADSEDVNGIFRVVDILTARLTEHWVAQTGETPNIEQIGTSNLEAYRHYEAGLANSRKYAWSEAVAEFEEAVRLDPQFASAHLRLYTEYKTVGNEVQAVSTLRVLDRLQHRLSRLQRLQYTAIKATSAGDLDAALRAQESLLQQAPRDALVRTSVAYRLLSEEPEKAIGIMRKGLALDPKDSFLWNQLAHDEAAVGDQKSAFDACAQYGMLIGKDDYLVASCRSDLHFMFGDTASAAIEYESWFDRTKSPAPERCSFQLAIIYSDQPNRLKMDRQFDCLRKAVPGSERAISNVVAQFQQSTGNPQAAVRAYEEWVVDALTRKRFTGATLALGSYSALAMAIGREQTALDFILTHGLEGRELAMVAVLEASLGRQAEADSALRSYAAANPEISSVALNRLRAEIGVLVALKRNDRAAAAPFLSDLGSTPITQALRYTAFLRGRARILVEDYQGAERDFKWTIRRNRDLGNWPTMRERLPVMEHLSHFYLGQIYETTGKRDNAMREYRSFLSHYQGSRSHLPQIAQARAALKRLGA